MIRRPNLARSPFADTRPVILVGSFLAVLGVVLTTLTVSELVGARGEEQELETTLLALQERRNNLVAEVRAVDQRLASTPWSTLEAETSVLRAVVAQRKLAWSDLLADLERVLPWDVRLVRISPRIGRDGAVQIGLRGIATSRQAWLRLLARLFYDERFSEPVPINEETPESGTRMGYRFNLRVRYWPEGRP